MLTLCGVCGLLPDIDTATSHIGRLLPEISLAIERRWGHRTLTHSLAAVLLVALVTLPLTGQWLLTLAYASHILLDMLIGGKRGVALLWPLHYRFSLGHIQPASPSELAIGLLALALVVMPLLAPALAIQATAIIPQAPTATPTPTPVPTLVTIRVDHVYEVDAEILVAVGDRVTQGQQVANLLHWRATLQAPPPTPSPTHTWILLPTLTPTETPTPYVAPTVSPLVLGAAWAELKMAHAQATLAAAPPDATAIARVCDEVPEMQSRLEAMRNGLWSDQLKRDAARLRGQDFAALEATLFEQERLIAEQVQRIAHQEQTCTEIQNRPHQAGPEELEIAAAQLQRAEIRYVQAIATPTRLPTPTATPTHAHRHAHALAATQRRGHAHLHARRRRCLRRHHHRRHRQRSPRRNRHRHRLRQPIHRASHPYLHPGPGQHRQPGRRTRRTRHRHPCARR